MRSAAGAEAGRATGEETAFGVVGEGDLAGNRELVAAGDGIHRFVVGDGFQLEIFAGAAEGSLLAHHGGDAIGFLAFGALLFTSLLAVLQTLQPLFQFLARLFLQCVTPYRSGAGPVKPEVKDRDSPPRLRDR